MKFENLKKALDLRRKRSKLLFKKVAHLGGSFSIIEILIVLFETKLEKMTNLY